MSDNKVAATFHPGTRPAYTCEWCGHIWSNPASATACCEYDRPGN